MVLGSGGFIGGAIARKLEASGAAVIGLGRKEVDLLADGASAGGLAALLQRRRRGGRRLGACALQDACHDAGEYPHDGVGAARLWRDSPVAHLIYVSSDAVYADGPLPLTEASPAAPTGLHGAMHLAREQMLSRPLPARHRSPFCGPTLVYGADDPHNGYGPNKFRRQANRGEAIVLFGEGEERRDHVDVDDIAEIVRLRAGAPLGRRA